ncbi:MAG: hypothetical protein JNK29_19845 [Anaerolineales bacterium]|nr:hypothetical protein [Anaerolineales bacterium]
MFSQAARRLQDALNQKADQIQREFVAISEDLKAISRRLREVSESERTALLAEQTSLHERQAALAAAINTWRDQARAIQRQPGEAALRTLLSDLQAAEDEAVQAAAGRALLILDAPEAELARLAAEAQPAQVTTTAATRLIQRARTEFDLRGVDPRARRAAAVEFANRASVLRDEAVLAELEAARADQDPLVREVAVQTIIQILRLRAMRLAELEDAYTAVQRLRQIDDPAVVPVFIEVLSQPRQGFVLEEAGPREADNHRMRRAALGGLVEWHTPAAQQAVRACHYDRNPEVVKLAALALELYPGEWTGPTAETRKAPPRAEDAPVP